DYFCATWDNSLRSVLF
nr:immunoglobulin light chain junction region [Macaca mulatta]MOV95251.1 immunoglobulin light chain junction region [Macaca mulatta]MOV95438.1 immunoglobulin light chain junction region [Macaca mulatta]MOV95637.1 immunoglobulin light chain junction region [Macaca mulatta]MOV96671.1 immunoglobulin light chain junction region [Macaca mulatta]